MKISLAECGGGARAIVRGIYGGFGIRRKLNRLGIHIGDPIRVLRGGFIGGPVLVEIHGIELGIGYGMAQKVEIEISE